MTSWISPPSETYSDQSAFKQRVGFAQTHLKRCGLLENPRIGVWRFSVTGELVDKIDPKAVSRMGGKRRTEPREPDQPDTQEGSATGEGPTVDVPTLDKLLNPTLQVIQRLGGTATNDETLDGVARMLLLSSKQIELLHDPGSGKQTELAYRLAIARRYLRGYELLHNPKPKLWSLTEKGAATGKVNPFAVILHCREKAWSESAARNARILPELTSIDATCD